MNKNLIDMSNEEIGAYIDELNRASEKRQQAYNKQLAFTAIKFAAIYLGTGVVIGILAGKTTKN